jgi:hypothetical protein
MDKRLCWPVGRPGSDDRCDTAAEGRRHARR